MDKNKVMLMTDANTDTGFGGVSDKIASGLSSANLDVSYIGWGFKYQSSIQRNGYNLLPSGNNPFGDDVLPYYLQTVKPEILITQADTRMVAYIPQMLKQIPNKPAWVFYVVVDGTVWQHDDKLKWPQNWSSIIKEADKVVAMSKYGQKVLKASDIDSTVIYHGVDTRQFMPLQEMNKKELKKQVGLKENSFVFSGVFKNMQRKCPEKYLQAFKIFLESKELTQTDKDNCILLLHTLPQPQGGGEYDLIEQCIDCGLQIGKNVVFSTQRLPQDKMQLIYQTSDAFLHLGTMEGFGVPIIEAMSCGLPIIGADSCTVPELIEGCGLLSKIPTYEDSHKISYGSYNGVTGDQVNPWEVAKLMLKLYKDEHLRKELGFKATEKAIKMFDWSIIQKQWVDLINSMIIKPEDIPEEWAKLMSDVKS